MANGLTTGPRPAVAEAQVAKPQADGGSPSRQVPDLPVQTLILEAMPDEIIRNIFEHVSSGVPSDAWDAAVRLHSQINYDIGRQSLYQACLVSSKVSKVAQACLFNSISLDGPETVMILLVTLERNPELGRLVRHLTVDFDLTSNDTVRELFVNKHILARLWDSDEDKVKYTDRTAAFIIDKFYNDSHTEKYDLPSLTAYSLTQVLIFAILWRTPNLETLRLNVPSSGDYPSDFDYNLLATAFAAHNLDRDDPSIERTPAEKQVLCPRLASLNISYSDVNWPSDRLMYGVDVDTYWPIIAHPNIEHLQLSCSNSRWGDEDQETFEDPAPLAAKSIHLLGPRMFPRRAAPFLSRAHNVRRLTVTNPHHVELVAIMISDDDWSVDEESTHYSWNTALEHVAGQLEELHFVHHEGYRPQFLDLTNEILYGPTDGLCVLPSMEMLTSLTAPLHALLPNASEAFLAKTPHLIQTFIPPNLVKLVILHAWEDMFRRPDGREAVCAEAYATHAGECFEQTGRVGLPIHENAGLFALHHFANRFELSCRSLVDVTFRCAMPSHGTQTQIDFGLRRGWQLQEAFERGGADFSFEIIIFTGPPPLWPRDRDDEAYVSVHESAMPSALNGYTGIYPSFIAGD